MPSPTPAAAACSLVAAAARPAGPLAALAPGARFRRPHDTVCWQVGLLAWASLAAQIAASYSARLQVDLEVHRIGRTESAAPPTRCTEQFGPHRLTEK